MDIIEYPSILYHGTSMNQETISSFRKKLVDKKYWRNNKDFGPGFYTTIDKKQAETFAIRQIKKATKRNETPCVLVLYFDHTCLEKIKTKQVVKQHIFVGESDKWAEYILEHRYHSSVSDCICKPHYDIIIGPMADNRGQNISSSVLACKSDNKGIKWFREQITARPNNERLKGFELGNQVVFSNEELANSVLALEGYYEWKNRKWVYKNASGSPRYTPS